MGMSKSQLRRYLASKFGEDSKELIDWLDGVRTGKIFFSHEVPGSIPGLTTQKVEYPSAALRVQIGLDLLSYAQGRPESSVHVTDDTPNKQVIDFDKLSDAEFEQLDRIVNKAKPEDTAQLIDVTPTKEES